MEKNTITVILIVLFIIFLIYFFTRITNREFMTEIIPINETIEWPIDSSLVGEPYGALIGIWKNDKLIHQVEYGYSDIMTGEKIQWNMHGRIGSITKTFTATIILMLVDEGLISLDDEARKYLDYIPPGITIQQLGNMTSGIYNYSLEEKMLDAQDKEPQKVWTPNELVTIGLHHDPLFMPGQGWSYSNTNTILLGLIAEKITGRSLGELYKTMIFEKLGLNNTFLPNNNQLPHPYFHGYMFGYNNEKNNIGLIIRDVTHDNPSWTWAAGELISTMDDMHIYIKALADGTLLSDKTRQLLQNSFVELGVADYGFGISRINDEWYGHNGQISGYQTYAAHSSKRDMSIVIMCDLFATRNGEGPADVIGRKLIEFITVNNI